MHFQCDVPPHAITDEGFRCFSSISSDNTRPEGPALHCGGRQAHRGRKVPGCLRLFEKPAGLLGALCGLGALLGAYRKQGSNVQLVELIAQRFF
jgi:hypothetical protein